MTPAMAFGRRGATWSAIMVPWLKPDQDQPVVGELVAGEFRIDEGVEERRRADGAVAKLALSTPASGNHWRPAGIVAARLGRVRRDEGGIRQATRPQAPDADQVVAVGAVAVQEDDQTLRRPAGRMNARPVEHRLHQTGTSFLRAARAVVGPEQRRGDAPPWRPALARSPPTSSTPDRLRDGEGIGDGVAERQIAGRKDVRMAEAEEQVDVRRPRPDAVDRGKPRVRLLGRQRRQARRGRGRRGRRRRRRAAS